MAVESEKMMKDILDKPNKAYEIYYARINVENIKYAVISKEPKKVMAEKDGFGTVS